MKRDLKSMGKKHDTDKQSKNTPKQEVKNDEVPKQEAKNLNKTPAISEEEVKKKTEELSKLSEGELYSELFKNVDEAKKSGSFTAEEVDNFLNTVSPMLTKEQLDKMNSLINKIK